DVDGVLPHSKTQKDGGLGVKTKHSFEDLVIQGKFRKALEEVRIIDSDKEFGRLIRPREDFIDRMEFLE
ncbi:MAG: hypothetical protein NZ480_08845, partial [Bdellovibrionaceae bacterium]|nr:hypothetical protein [Pseudobdellovibrionaceae bacterium]